MRHKLNKKSKVFVSYRRQDSSAMAGRIHDSLIKYFPKLDIFMDVEAIAGGENFSERIFSSIEQADIFICLIGNKWAVSEDGEDRLHMPDDYVRKEIAAGLDSGCKVYPILLNECKFPDKRTLPVELKNLCTLNALELRDSRFNDDLLNIIENIFSVRRQQLETKRLPKLLKSLLVGIPIGLVFLFLIAQINYGLSGKSLALNLGEGLTTTIIILTPIISSLLSYKMSKY